MTLLSTIEAGLVIEIAKRFNYLYGETFPIPDVLVGDVWLLGGHRLLCGDSGNPADVDHLLAGQPIHLCNMDPPYNVRVEPRSNNAIAAGLIQAHYLPRLAAAAAAATRDHRD